MLKADFTRQFKMDYRATILKKWDISLVDAIISDLINEIPLTINIRIILYLGITSAAGNAISNPIGCLFTRLARALSSLSGWGHIQIYFSGFDNTRVITSDLYK
jgi:hypothetical protein